MRPLTRSRESIATPPWAWDIVCLLAIAAASTWLTWPLVSRLAHSLNQSPDSLLNVWALGWNFHALSQNPLTLFQANIFAPRPDTLAYSEHLFGITLLVAPVYVLTKNLVLANNVAIFLSFWLTGAGMFLLVRRLTGSRWAGCVAGIALLAMPYRFQHLPQVQLLSFQWMGFALWALARFLDRARFVDGAALALFVLWQVLSCNYYAVDTAVLFSVFALVLAAIGRAWLDRRRVIGLLLGAAFVSACALPFVAPYQRVRDEQGFFRRIEDVQHFSARPIDYARPSAYNRAPHWDVLPRRYISERVLFPGFAAIALAGFGVALGWRGRKADGSNGRPSITRIFTIGAIAVAIVGAVLSFGPEIRLTDEATLSTPYRWLYRYIPGFNGIRVPARHAVMAFVAIAMLAGLGTSRILAASPRRHVAGALIALALLFDVQTYSTERAFPTAPAIPPVYEWLSDQPGDGAVLVLPIHDADAITEEAWPMYYSTLHFKPLVNGFSGWWPNDYWELVGRLRHFPTSTSLRFLLERAPVEYIVIHYDRLDDVRRRHLMAAMERYQSRLPMQVRFGSDIVYRVADAAEADE